MKILNKDYIENRYIINSYCYNPHFSEIANSKYRRKNACFDISISDSLYYNRTTQLKNNTLLSFAQQYYNMNISSRPKLSFITFSNSYGEIIAIDISILNFIIKTSCQSNNHVLKNNNLFNYYKDNHELHSCATLFKVKKYL